MSWECLICHSIYTGCGINSYDIPDINEKTGDALSFKICEDCFEKNGKSVKYMIRHIYYKIESRSVTTVASRAKQINDPHQKTLINIFAVNV